MDWLKPIPTEVWLPKAIIGLQVILILLGAWLASRIGRRLLYHVRQASMRAMQKRGGASELEVEKRASTIIMMFERLAGVLIWMIAGFMAVSQMGFDVKPLIAGAGVAGLAVGLGAQSIIKDVIAGLFMLIDNQVRLNDVVSINGTGGVVEEINLRTTILRGENGAVHIFQNGNIQTLSNLTREFSYWVFEIPIAPRQDTDHALSIIKREADSLLQEAEYRAVILAPLELYGVDRITDVGWVLKGRIKTLPSKQFMIGRELNRRVKIAFEAEGLQFPEPVTRLKPQ